MYEISPYWLKETVQSTIFHAVAQKDFKPQQIDFILFLTACLNIAKNKAKVNLLHNFAKTHYEQKNKTIVHSNLCVMRSDIRMFAQKQVHTTHNNNAEWVLP